MIETALDTIISKITVRLKNVNNDYIRKWSSLLSGEL